MAAIAPRTLTRALATTSRSFTSTRALRPGRSLSSMRQTTTTTTTTTTSSAPIQRRFASGGFNYAEQPRLRLGSEAPNFDAKTTHGDINFHQWLGGSWAVLFSHPADFTPVCTTELGAFARLKDQFDRRGVKMLGLSANDLGSHDEWVADINEFADTRVQFPIIADADRRVAFLYDMISHDDLEKFNREGGVAFTIRSVFVIDPAKKIRLTMMYPASTGRNTAEVLRVIDSLQTGDKKGVTTPIDWQMGDDVIVPPSVSTEDAKKKFGKVREFRPYLRFVKDQ